LSIYFFLCSAPSLFSDTHRSCPHSSPDFFRSIRSDFDHWMFGSGQVNVYKDFFLSISNPLLALYCMARSNLLSESVCICGRNGSRSFQIFSLRIIFSVLSISLLSDSIQAETKPRAIHPFLFFFSAVVTGIALFEVFKK